MLSEYLMGMAVLNGVEELMLQILQICSIAADGKGTDTFIWTGPPATKINCISDDGNVVA